MGGEVEKEGYGELRSSVIDAGLCTMCGGCVSSCPVSVLEYSKDSIALKGDCIECGTCMRVCPGRGIDMSLHEKELYGRSRRKTIGTRFGMYIERKHLTSSRMEFVRASYYGGRVASVLISAMEEGHIDSALMTDWGDEGLISQGRAAIARSREEVLSLVSSKYVFSPVLTLLKEVHEDETLHRLAVVGLPCHVQALRKMMKDPVASKYTTKVCYVIGLNCGGPLRSEDEWRTSISPLLGAEPGQIVEFRAHKVTGTSIRLDAKLKDGAQITKVVPISSYLSVFAKGPIWGRCLMCMDYSAELSDVTFGAPIIRSEKGKKLLDDALEKGYLKPSSYKKRFTQNVTDLYAGRRKKRRALKNIRKRASKGEPVPEYG
jgi:coenzyme F420 hydrogenase subunit beta